MLSLQVPPREVSGVGVTVEADTGKGDMKLEFLYVVLTFFLHDFGVADTGAYQTGFERSHCCALVFPALRLAQLHVEP
eukprot:6212377-Pleurochrysis_carterae.AAC.2